MIKRIVFICFSLAVISNQIPFGGSSSESNKGRSECIEGKFRVKGTLQCSKRWLIDYSKVKVEGQSLKYEGWP